MLRAIIKGRWRSASVLGLLLVSLWGCSSQEGAGPVPISAEQRELRDRGLGELENERPEQAERYFSELLAQLPADPLPRFNLSVSLLRQHRLSEARETLKPLLDGPAAARALALSAVIEQQAGDLAAALKLLEQSLAANQNDTEAVHGAFNLASQMRGAQAEALAAAALKQLRLLRPDNPWVALKSLQDGLNRQQRGEASTSFLRLKELSWRFDDGAREVLAAIESALNAGQLESARADALRLENLMRASAFYRESLNELRVGILGVPMEHFAAAASPEIPPASARIEFVPQSVLTPAGSTLALAAGDLDGDGRAEVLALVSEGSSLGLRWWDGAEQFSVGRELALPFSAESEVWNLRLVDLDNDDRLDALLWGSAGIWMIRGDAERGFAPIDRERDALFWPAQALAAIDFDHEGDLDLVLIDAEGRPQLLRNNLGGTWDAVGDLAFASSLSPVVGARALIGSDLDRDEDLDFLLLHEGGISRFDNRRYGEFVQRAQTQAGAGVQAMALADLDNDGSIDLLQARGTELEVAFNRAGEFAHPRTYSHNAGEVDQLVIADFDNDGRKDWLVKGKDRTEIHLQQTGGEGRMVWASPAATGPLQVADLDGDGLLDLLMAEPDRLRLWRNQSGSAHGWLSVRLRGLTSGNSKNNSYGLGSSIEVRNGDAYQRFEVTDAVTHIGLGAAPSAQVLRVLWTNGVPQNRFDLQRNQAVVEEQVLKGSCPFLYAWNGERFEFVTDLLWGAPLGLPVAPGKWLPADPSELVRVDQLVARDGVYQIRITEELWEAAFFDKVRLWVVDHPEEVEVVSNLRILPGEVLPDQILGSKQLEPLAHAYDGQGREVTAEVAERDEIYAAGYTPSRYQGVAADPWVFTMDLGRAPRGPVRLHLEGWIFPADASLNLAVAQRKDIPYLPPQIEVKTAQGWQPLLPNAGFPAGKTKAMVIDLPALPAGSQELRMVTNLWLHWDRIRWTESVDDSNFEIRAKLLPLTAQLSERGYSRLLRQAPNAPHHYDYDSVSREAPWLPLPGRYTRLGEVLPLLTEADDFSVILASGDELSLDFSAVELPAPASGMRRTLFLESHGWDKDADLNTFEAQQLEPLPFRAMSGYPWTPDEAYPDTAAYRNYRDQWLTRELR
ncbi:MAG: VCBS repeat-containing protein [Xanthomonadales bacterium]|nr:VCBS repeat-containing protein [Xanthomonadales bacterium]